MSTAPTSLPDTTEPVATVRHYIESFNNGDAKTMAAMCTIPMSILDGMAPHIWHGPTAAEDWYRDAMIEGEHLGATSYSVTLGEPTHNNITGDSAYVVIPTTMTFKLEGIQITQSGAFLRWRFASSTTGGASRPGLGPKELHSRARDQSS